MKRMLFTTLAFVLTSNLLTAQDTVYLRKEGKKKVFTDRPPQAVFAELGGAGLFFSGNYDRRFNKQTDGLGWRAGLGYNFESNYKFTTLPIGINYLAGDKNRGRYFEVGVNSTLLFASNNNYNNYNLVGNIYIQPGSTILITIFNIGYRSQPTKGGFNFRGGISPYFIKNETAITGYLSFGYNF